MAAHPDLRAGIAWCEQVQDYVSRDLLREILDGEEEHIDWLETQLQLIERVGIQNYQQKPDRRQIRFLTHPHGTLRGGAPKKIAENHRATFGVSGPSCRVVRSFTTLLVAAVAGTLDLPAPRWMTSSGR